MTEAPAPISTDIIIVGAGMTGCTLALALVEAGFDVTLLERGEAVRPPVANHPEQQGHTLTGVVPGRVISLNQQSMTALAGVGVPPDAYTHFPFHRIHAIDGNGSGSFSISASELGLSSLGSIVNTDAPLSVMQDRIQRVDGITTRFDTALTSLEFAPDHCLVALSDGTCLQTRLVVAADGGQSTVRAMAGIRQIGWSYRQQAVVCNALCTRAHLGEASQVFLGSGPVALLPLSASDQRLVSVVWSHDAADVLCDLDDEAFCTALTEATEGRCGDVVAVTQRFSFPLLQYQALGYVRAHLVLLGDAAHTIHPLAGQGANLGIADALALADVLSRCRYTGQSPGDVSLLRTYERRRMPVNVAMAGVMEGFYRLFGNSHLLPLWIRSRGMSELARMSGVRKLIGQLATGALEGHGHRRPIVEAAPNERTQNKHRQDKGTHNV